MSRPDLFQEEYALNFHPVHLDVSRNDNVQLLSVRTQHTDPDEIRGFGSRRRFDVRKSCW